MAQESAEDRNAMSFRDLVSWGWRETHPVHQNTMNLVIHVFAVPLFVVGHLLLVAAIVVDARFLIAALLCIVVSLKLQKYGHSLEPNPPIPFAGPRDFLRRIYAEQFCNFWRFLLSGQWYANLKASGRNA